MGFALSLQKQAGENQRGNKYSSYSFFFCPSILAWCIVKFQRRHYQ